MNLRYLRKAASLLRVANIIFPTTMMCVSALQGQWVFAGLFGMLLVFGCYRLIYVAREIKVMQITAVLMAMGNGKRSP